MTVPEQPTRHTGIHVRRLVIDTAAILGGTVLGGIYLSHTHVVGWKFILMGLVWGAGALALVVVFEFARKRYSNNGWALGVTIALVIIAPVIWPDLRDRALIAGPLLVGAASFLDHFIAGRGSTTARN
ncbi:MAG TPA: hypothetical protein VHQ86_04675 [Candidatus Saccharimonadia bacterium]|nr:hypothetical protein [Candidatus Saccharimonadia bacterium]